MTKPKKNPKTSYSKGSKNVFKDLGLQDSGELMARAKLGRSVRILLEKRK